MRSILASSSSHEAANIGLESPDPTNNRRTSTTNSLVALDHLSRKREVVRSEFAVDEITVVEDGPANNLGTKTASTGNSLSESKEKTSSASTTANKAAEEDDISEPIDPPPGFPQLDFRPFQLRTWFLLTTASFFFLCFASVASLLVLSNRRSGPFNPGNKYYYLAARYVPTIIGTLTTMLWKTTVLTLVRIAPYISMASDSGAMQRVPRKDRDKRSANFPFIALNVLSFARRRFLITVAAHSVGILNIALVPTKSAFIYPPQSPIYVSILDENASIKDSAAEASQFSVQVSPVISYLLLAAYGSLFVMIITIFMRLRGRKTGLKWDPISLADKMHLLHGCNQLFRVLEGIESEELHKRINHQDLWERFRNIDSVRLGYWKRANGQIWHGFGLTKAATEPDSTFPIGQLECNHEGQSRSDNSETTHTFSEKRYCFRYLIFSRKFVLLFMILTVMIVSIVGMFQESFQSGDFSTGSFEGSWASDHTAAVVEVAVLWRILPTMLAQMWAAAFAFTEQGLSILQPYIEMSKVGGAYAQISVLLSYTQLLPVQHTFVALRSKHYRLAIVSLMNLISAAFPIVVGGAFVARPEFSSTESTGTQYVAFLRYRMTASALSMYFIIAYLGLSILMFGLFLLVDRSCYRLFRNPDPLASFLTLCYDSFALRDKDIFQAADHENDTQSHLYARAIAKGEKYALGLLRKGCISGVEKQRMGLDYEWNILRIKFDGQADNLETYHNKAMRRRKAERRKRQDEENGLTVAGVCICRCAKCSCQCHKVSSVVARRRLVLMI
ncbi:hypothetical protein BJ508DRAFT_300681 [Ascobolus immersus RN42]|uniref:Uncharacterized protein n=1 Tax=Ascobolus immersus RN42 TaxID=1160509 RepID=A0A3N4INU8_ASCIM|nr:hypothetical protein BJ508DRAFT_300681 [Ascobolus immersus RN42]